MKLGELLVEAGMPVDDKKILDAIVKWHKQNFDLSSVQIPKKYQTKERDYYYRGVVLSNDDFETLQDGESIDLPSKGFSSWTLDLDVAKQFANGSGSRTGIVIKKDSSKLNVILNIESFFFMNKLMIADFLDRPDEQEVIVKDNQNTLTISKNDIVEE